MGVPLVAAHYDERDIAHVSKYVVEVLQTPHPEKSKEAFVELLIEHAADLGGSLLVPASDESLVTLSQNKHLLEPYYTVACPDWDVVEKCVDKKLTALLADAIGVPAPKTVLIRSIEDAEKYEKAVEYPALLKPSLSHQFYDLYKKKMIVVDDSAQMLEAYSKIADSGLEMMLQEFIPGDDTHGINYNSYFWDGQPIVEFTARQIRNAPPWYGSPRVVVSEEIPEAVESGRKMLKALGYNGYSNIEFKWDSRDGVYKLMEINARHNLSSLLAVHLGVNFPWIEYQHLIHGELPSEPPTDYQTGVYWIDIVRDVSYSLMNLGKERLSIAELIRPYLKPHVFAIFDWKDLRPFIKRCTYLVKAAFEAVGSFIGPKREENSKPQAVEA